MINFAVMPISIMDAAWVREVLHRGAVAYGFFGVAILAGMVLGSLTGSVWEKAWGLTRTLIAGIAVTGLMLLGMAVLPRFFPNLLFLLLAGLGIGAVNAVLSTHIILNTAAPLRGRVAGALMTLTTMATPPGAALVGWASVPLGLPWLFRLSGILIFLLSLGFIGIPSSSASAPEDSHAPAFPEA